MEQLNKMQCKNCLYKKNGSLGIPCIPCAYIKYHGKMGPGHINGKRTLVHEPGMEIYYNNIIIWIQNNPLQTIKINSELLPSA